MKFLHAADIHLDSPLIGLGRYEGAPAEDIRVASRHALIKLVDLALLEQVAFVLLAGDLYDGDWPDFNTGLFFIKQMVRLKQNNVPVVLVTGNHDAASRITPELTCPENVRILPTDRPDTIRFEKHRVAVHGQGFAQQAETRNLAMNYPSPVAGWFNIGLLHTSLDGSRQGHDRYAPCTIADLVGKEYNYWALGHIHKRESVNGANHPRIEYPGNIQGRHIRESGPKGCLLVTVNPNGTSATEFRPLDVFRWERLSVDVSAETDLNGAVGAAAVKIAEAAERADHRPLGVRIEFCGVSPAHDALVADISSLTAEVRARALLEAAGRVWVEKVRVETKRPGIEVAADAVADDALSVIQGVITFLRSDPAKVAELLVKGDCPNLRSKVPGRFRWRESLEDSEAIRVWLERAENILNHKSGVRQEDAQ